jgi:predicted permease
MMLRFRSMTAATVGLALFLLWVALACVARSAEPPASPSATKGEARVAAASLHDAHATGVGQGNGLPDGAAEPPSASASDAGHGPHASMLDELWNNFRHNLFKPLLLFFYLGFLMPLMKVEFEFPYVIYQGLTIYLLLAIGWHGGEELAGLSPSSLLGAVGFMIVGLFLNFVIGILAYFALKTFTKLREIDKATVAGYYGSDSAGTIVTCLGVLATAHIAYFYCHRWPTRVG